MSNRPNRLKAQISMRTRDRPKWISRYMNKSISPIV